MEELLIKKTEDVESYSSSQIVKLVFDPKTIPDTAEYLALCDERKNMKPVYRDLFRLRFVEKVSEISVLKSRLCIEDDGVFSSICEDFENYLAVVTEDGLNIERVKQMCIECLVPAVVSYSRKGLKIGRVCGVCGLEQSDSKISDNFEIRIPFGSTFANECLLAPGKGLGHTYFYPKKNLHHSLFDIGDDFDDFKKMHPDVAKELLTNYEVIAFGNVFHLMENGMGIVRHMTIDNYYKAKQKMWHSYDKPLRALLMNNYNQEKPSKLNTVLKKANDLIDLYGFNRNNMDNQVFMKSFAQDIRKVIRILHAFDISFSPQVIADTLFYRKLCVYGKSDVAKEAKPNLKISCALINFFSDSQEFERSHEKLSDSPSLLGAIEAMGQARNIS